jgi:hypothetical protein
MGKNGVVTTGLVGEPESNRKVMSSGQVKPSSGAEVIRNAASFR